MPCTSNPPTERTVCLTLVSVTNKRREKSHQKWADYVWEASEKMQKTKHVQSKCLTRMEGIRCTMEIVIFKLVNKSAHGIVHRYFFSLLFQHSDNVTIEMSTQTGVFVIYLPTLRLILNLQFTNSLFSNKLLKRVYIIHYTHTIYMYFKFMACHLPYQFTIEVTFVWTILLYMEMSESEWIDSTVNSSHWLTMIRCHSMDAIDKDCCIVELNLETKIRTCAFVEHSNWIYCLLLQLYHWNESKL